jgi:hypothetical protein
LVDERKLIEIEEGRGHQHSDDQTDIKEFERYRRFFSMIFYAISVSHLGVPIL